MSYQHPFESHSAGRGTLQTIRRPHLVFALVAVNLLDAITTYIGIRQGFSEMNPFLAALIAEIGLLPALVVGFTATTVLLVGILEFHCWASNHWISLDRNVRKLRIGGYGLAISILSVVVVWNVFLLGGVV